MIKKIHKHLSVVLTVACLMIVTAMVLPIVTNAITTQLTPKEVAACIKTATNQQKTAIALAKSTYKKETAAAKATKDKAALKAATATYNKAVKEAKKVFDLERKACKTAVVLPTKQVPTPTAATPPAPPTPDISCASPTDTSHMDIFDSHAHANPKVSMSQIISVMDKAGVSMTNLYGEDSSTRGAISQYPGRFVTFIDTPGDWLEQGQAFVATAEAQMKTGKYYGIGETNLRYYTGKLIPPPTVSIPADTPAWLKLVDLSEKYHVPISFHFVPDDSTANAAFERMLNHNKDATLIWAHLGFNNMTLNSATLNDYLLRYPHLYFDTAGIQNMQQDPGPQTNSNWWMLTSQSNNGRLNTEWKKFFETWNSRFLFGSDAGGGGNGMERWLNYASEAVKEGATPDAVGHWRNLLSNLDSNSARNILNGNSRELFLKEQKPVYNYSVSSDGMCYSISVRSKSSVSALTFDSSTRTITFTVADSNATAGNAVITIPTALGKNFTASVDGQSVKSQSTSNSTSTTISLEYAGGIRTITLVVK